MNGRKIAHVTATFPPYGGGTGMVCFYQARELARRGHEVHVFTAASNNPSILQNESSFFVHTLRPWLQLGNAPLLPQLFSNLRHFDVIHLHYPFIFGAEIVRLAATMYRTPLVVNFHNDLIGDGFRARIFSLYQHMSSRLVVRGAVKLCVVSKDHYQASNLRQLLNGRGPQVVELPNGVDCRHFEPKEPLDFRSQYSIPQDGKLIGFVATLDRAHHFKGLDILLRAIALLPADYWLIIIGDGDQRRLYEQQADNLGIKRRTVFVGAIEHNNLPSFYSSVDVTVLPSSPPESFGLVLVESLACRTPVIASDIPGVRTVVSKDKDGFLAEPGNVQDLAKKICTFLNLPDAKIQEMAEYGVNKVRRRYSWDKITEQLEMLYEQVIN